MTSGSLPKKILLFSLPLIFTNLLQVLFNMADIAVVGRFAGPEALGSVGSTAIIVTLFTGFLIGVASGINVLAARYIGSREKKELSSTVHTSLILSIAVGLVLGIAGIAFARGFLMLLDTKPELLDGAVLYLRIYFIGMPALSLYNFGNSVLSAAGDTKRPLVYLGIAGVLNVLLNLFFVIVCRLSVAGVALASIISQYLSAFLILRFLFRCGEDYGLSVKMLKGEGNKARALLALGLPAGFQNSVFAIANLFIQTAVNSFDTVVVEGNSAAVNSDALVYDVMMAFYMACSSFMGQNFGAGKRDRVLKSYLICLAYSFGIGAVMGISLALGGEQFLSLFTDDPEVIKYGMQRLVIMGFSYAVSAFMDCTIAASRGLGKSFWPTFIVIMGACVFRVIWICTVFAYFRTLPSIYFLYIFSWSITSVAEIAYFVKVYRNTVITA